MLKFRVEITMNQQVQGLTVARAETLMLILDAPPAGKRIDKMAESRDVSVQAQHDLCQRMVDTGTIRLNKDGRAHRATLTELGWERASAVSRGGGRTPADVEVADAEAYNTYVKRLHGVVAGLKVRGGEELPENWRNILQERSDLEWVRYEQDGRELWTAVVSGWEVHFHRRVVTLYMKRPIEKFAVDACVRALFERIGLVRDRLERMAGADLLVDEIRMGRQELGVEGHYMAEMVEQMCEEFDHVRPQDIQVLNPDTGKEEAGYDRSPGSVELELKGERADVIANTVEERTRNMAHHPEGERAEMMLGRELAERGLGGREFVGLALDGVEEGVGSDTSDTREQGGRQSQINEHLGWGWEW